MLDTATEAGATIRAARIDRGWDYKQFLLEVRNHPKLGPKYRIGLSTLRAIEAGRTKRPHVRAAFAIATVLEVPVRHLWPEL